MSIEARQIQETLHSYAAILNFTPSPQGLRAKFGACSVQNAQLLPGGINRCQGDELKTAVNNVLLYAHIVQSCQEYCGVLSHMIIS